MKTKTIVGIGCGIFVLIGLVVGLVVAVALGGAYYAVKNVEEYQCGLATLKKSEKAKTILGEPITDGFWVQPNVKIEGSKREAYISGSVSGPKGSGTIYISSYRDNFRDNYSLLLEANGEKISIHNGTFPCTDGTDR